MMTRLLLAFVCVWEMAGHEANCLAQVNQDSPKTQASLSTARANLTATLRAAVAFWEDRLQKELRLQAGGNGAEDGVDRTRVQLAWARHDLAVNEHNSQTIAEQRRLLVKLHTRHLERLQQLGGQRAASPAEVEAAQRQLALVRWGVAQLEGNREAALEQLRLVIQLSRREWELFQKLLPLGATSEAGMKRAHGRLIMARYLLARELRSDKEVLQQLRLGTELYQAEWERTQRLLGGGAITVFDEYFTQYDLFHAKLRLADAERKPETILEQLRRLVDLHEKTLPRVDVKDWETEEFQLGLRVGLAWKRYRLAEFQQQATFKDTLAPAELHR